MKNSKSPDIQSLINILVCEEYFTVEEVAEELGVSQADVHRTLLKLRVQPGWSIIEINRATDDYDQPKWTPTTFHIAKRP